MYLQNDHLAVHCVQIVLAKRQKDKCKTYLWKIFDSTTLKNAIFYIESIDFALPTQKSQKLDWKYKNFHKYWFIKFNEITLSCLDNC